jgi:predicted TIM-barrel fold metal-dependent hydrolase
VTFRIGTAAGSAILLVQLFTGRQRGWQRRRPIHRRLIGGADGRDEQQQLQLVVGHMGETLPFMLQRLDRMPMAMTKLSHPISFYLRENVHYTFSGFNFTPTFLDLLLQVGVDRIMFSADYPYASMDEARTFLDQLPVSTADRERIARGNADRLWGS